MFHLTLVVLFTIFLYSTPHNVISAGNTSIIQVERVSVNACLTQRFSSRKISFCPWTGRVAGFRWNSSTMKLLYVDCSGLSIIKKLGASSLYLLYRAYPYS